MKTEIGIKIEERIKLLKMKKGDVARMFGVSDKTLYNWIQGKVPIPKTKEKMIEAFLVADYEQDVATSLDGPIITEEPTADKPVIIEQPTAEGNPYYDVDFTGGFDIMVNDQTTRPDGYVNLPTYNSPGTLWCNITGHSMEPMINHGDIIAIRELKDWHSYLPKGEVYGIITSNGLRTVKIVRKGSDMRHLRLVPVNTAEYDEEEIDVTTITKVFQVLGSIKRF